MFEETVDFIRSIYGREGTIALHEPRFSGNEKKNLAECIDSTYVSSVGKFVDQFEEMMCELTGARHAVAVVNGTNGLQIALKVCGVKADDLVITQSLSFVATCNAISYLGAKPLFVDVDMDTLGLSPAKLRAFLESETELRDDGHTYHKKLGSRISACIPMHSFGFPCRIDEIVEECDKHNIVVVEDAAEALGTSLNGKHAGTFGKCGVYSLNGNKIITSGGGGVIVSDDQDLAKRAKHITTVAKIPHRWKFEHDEIGYNFRMPNLNAALACAQLEQLDHFVKAKRDLALRYKQFFTAYSDITWIEEPKGAHSNYWLNSILFENADEKDAFLEYSNDKGVMTRPAWELLSGLEMYKNCYSHDLDNSISISKRLVSLPSSVPPFELNRK